MNNLNYIKELLKQNKIKTVLTELDNVLKNSKSSEIILLSARYEAISEQIRSDIIDFEKATIAQNKIRHSLLELINDAEIRILKEKKEHFNQISAKTKELINLCNEILIENQQILLPLLNLNDTMKMANIKTIVKEVTQRVNTLYNFQKSRSKFGEYLGFFERVAENEENPEIRNIVSKIVTKIHHFMNSLYRTAERTEIVIFGGAFISEIGFPKLKSKMETEDGKFGLYHQLREVSSTKKIYKIIDIHTIANHYLNHLRSIVTDLGFYSGNLQAFYNVNPK